MASRTTPERLEMINFMWQELPAYISYWADITAEDDDTYHLVEVEYPDEDDARHTLTRAQFAAGMGRWAREAPHHSDYHKRAAEDIKRSRWERFDYDAEIVDAIAQWALFGYYQYS